MRTDTKTIILGILRMAEENSQLLNNEAEQKSKEYSKVSLELEALKDQIHTAKPIGTLYPLDVIAYTVGFMYGNPGKKIQAIKAVRDRFGYNLKESKDLVDALSTPSDYVEYKDRV